MEVPQDFSLTGWYVHSPRPGDSGPAVLAGHVSSSAGPGVFYHLKDLEPGDTVHVTRDDGQRVTFTVHRLEQYPKEQVPEEQVYGSTEGPELRLITCGGTFDYQQRRHRDNIVVFASRA
jgi:sortase (surface protein transpeptidase)